MKAYVCSIGEATTELCCEQLERYGFEIVLLDEIEPWINKYKKFITEANESCLRIDADIIVNKNIQEIKEFCNSYNTDKKMIQFSYWDYYKNDIGIGNPIWYSRDCLSLLKANINKILEFRPETSAWRLPEIVDETETNELVVGIHGIAQKELHIENAKDNKIKRKQINDYDFDLVNRINKIIVKNNS